ncbi:MAG TPA: terminase family protein [Acetobacteraceae bacterium]|nr:terminase family protein [Acetobacteraceae bacterium]
MTKTSPFGPAMKEPEADYVRPWLYPRQLAAIFHGERYGIVEASTKAGKTVACLVWLVEQAMHGGEGQAFWWVAPVYAQAEIAFRRMKIGLPKEYRVVNETKLTVTLANGAVIWFKSGEKPDTLYGEDVGAAVIDEASRVREEAWHAIRSTLTATQGPVRIIGNVKGRRNWFYHLARRAEGGEPGMRYARLTAMDAVEAGVLNAAEVQDAERALPAAVFRELYLAEASDDGANPFGLDAIAACVTDMSAAAPICWGWDLAKSRDWTVGIALDAEGGVCRLERWQAPWQETIARVREAAGELPALVDATGAGDPVLEALQRGGAGNFAGFKFSATSKQQLMEGLAVAIQRRELRFPDGVLRAELDSFAFEYTRTGVRYAAPEGVHDDCVCALALAWRKAREAEPASGVLGWMMRVLAEQRETSNPKAPEPRGNEGTLAMNDTGADLYAAARQRLGLDARWLCARCGGVIGGSRVTDGVQSWHPECR